ncbi:S8 family serine peptidase [Halococcus saccharolyticus]|uniref:S8 family serine peptidase n=1 Tax=Halococcus saccharolyticus TaxID=62319 RepID=UPI00403FDB9F
MDSKPNELLVGVTSSANARQTAERALPPEAQVIAENAALGYVRIELPEQASTTAKARIAGRIADRPGVEYAEPNTVYETLVVPNDPRFSEQYAPQTVNAPGAWDTTLGDAGVTIAIVDQGIKYDHPDLDGNIASDLGRDFVDSDDDPYPDISADEHHGTHVAGIAAAGTDNATGIAGISNATLLSVRTLDENGVGSTADIADGIQWATDNGADIINLSLGGGGYTETLQKSVTYAHQNGVVLVAAAGNDYSGPVSYPAAYDECIAVSALDPSGSLAPYSNTGAEIELAAPGTNLLSTWTDNDYAPLSGTSMAAPVVSGVAGLVLSQQDLSNEEVRTQLKETAVDAGLSDEKQGAGQIDAAVAVDSRFSVLTIEGTGDSTEYTVAAGNTLDKTTANDSSINSDDDLWGTTASGYVVAGRDSYTFSGGLAALDIEGDARVYRDGQRIDPNEYPDSVLTIEGAGSRAEYTLSVFEALEKTTANDSSIGSGDAVSGATATGYVKWGRDSYAFSGGVAALQVPDNATVYLDGMIINPEKYPDSVLTIEGSGSRADYTVAAGNTLDKTTANDSSINSSDDHWRSTASGHVAAGRDSYVVSGDIVALQAADSATVYLNGQRIDPDQYPDSVLTVEGTGTVAEYTVAADGSLRKTSANGSSIDSDDRWRSTATGYVVAGRDSYTFSGGLAALDIEGDARVYRDGQRIDPNEYPDSVLTIEGAGSRAEYTLSVFEALEKTTANDSSIGSGDAVSGATATGYVKWGRDSYALSSGVNRLDIDGDARVFLDGQPIDPSQFSDSVLTIDGPGSMTDYRISVSGDLEKTTANGASVNSDDRVSGSTASGYVVAGRDSYTFSGSISRFVLNARARVVLDRSNETITIDGNGPGTTYSIRVSDSIESVDTEPRDTVRQRSAEGYVSSYSDVYRYTGDLESVVVGETTVTVNGATPLDPESPTVGIYSGLSDADFSTVGRMEQWQGTPYPIQNLFVPWNADTGHMNWLFDRILPKIWNAGRTPLITWEPYTPGARTASVDTQSLVEQSEYDAYLESLASTTPDDIEVRIGNGDYDGYIDRWAGRLRNALSESSSRRAYLRLAHEMNGDWYPWSPTVGSSSAGSYIDMWQRVRDRFEQRGLDENTVEWMWCVNAEDIGSYSAEQLYPGDGYVDWLGVDGYNWGTSQSWSSWESPEGIYSGMLDRLRDLADKPVCVAEFASSSKTASGYDPQRKGNWIRNALTYFDERGVDMWCWFNEDKETDWAVFDGVRGSETVTHNGEQVNAYGGYRKTVGTDVTAANATMPESLVAKRIDGD